MLARGTHSSIDAGSQYGTGFFGEKGSWESGIWMEGLGNQAARGKTALSPVLTKECTSRLAFPLLLTPHPTFRWCTFHHHPP